MNSKPLIFLSFCALLLTPHLLHSYDLILKNGKTVHGTLINETKDLIVLRDMSGTQINFKKTAIDLEKTSVANTPVAPQVQPEPAKTQQSSAQPATQTKKKPARVMTENDIQRLREKYDLGEGLYRARQSDSSTAASDKEEKTEQDWRDEAQEMTGRAQQAEQLYNQLKQQCDRMKTATVQTHMMINGKNGHPLPMSEAREEICNQAEDAQAAFEDARQQYRDFMESARQENVPPGYLAADPEYQEKLEKDEN